MKVGANKKPQKHLACPKGQLGTRQECCSHIQLVYALQVHREGGFLPVSSCAPLCCACLLENSCIEAFAWVFASGARAHMHAHTCACKHGCVDSSTHTCTRTSGPVPRPCCIHGSRGSLLLVTSVYGPLPSPRMLCSYRLASCSSLARSFPCPCSHLQYLSPALPAPALARTAPHQPSLPLLLPAPRADQFPRQASSDRSSVLQQGQVRRYPDMEPGFDNNPRRLQVRGAAQPLHSLAAPPVR